MLFFEVSIRWIDNIMVQPNIVLTKLGYGFILSDMEMKRGLYKNIWERLSAHQQMVFIAGPRQAGKTTFTQILAEDFNNSLYFNWDILDEKRKLIENPSFYEEVHRKDNSVPLIIFDELHKYSNWNDLGLGNLALHYIRNREKEEVDFLISNNHNPLILIETKLSDDHASKSLIKFQRVLNIPAVQLVNRRHICKIISNDNLRIMIISADHWLSLLP